MNIFFTANQPLFGQNQAYPEVCNTDLNILLLGETGVGKSTWINGFANYLTYPTLEEAEMNESIYLIPTSFTLSDENYKERVISTGSDTNEEHEAGKSATQSSKTYLFTSKGIQVRLIDTPGIGNRRLQGN